MISDFVRAVVRNIANWNAPRAARFKLDVIQPYTGTDNQAATRYTVEQEVVYF